MHGKGLSQTSMDARINRTVSHQSSSFQQAFILYTVRLCHGSIAVKQRIWPSCRTANLGAGAASSELLRHCIVRVIPHLGPAGPRGRNFGALVLENMPKGATGEETNLCTVKLI